MAVSALGDRSTFATWQLILQEKGVLVLGIMTPLKSSSVKLRRPGASSSHSGSFREAVSRLFGVLNVDFSPLEC